MIDGPQRRAGHGDKTDWAGVCVDFPGLRRRAENFGYGSRLDRLAEQVRRGHRQLADWHALMGELAELAAEEEHVSWRDDRQRALAAWPSSLDPGRAGFACPGDLCSRRSGPSFGPPPTCGLLGRPMIDLGSTR